MREREVKPAGQRERVAQEGEKKPPLDHLVVGARDRRERMPQLRGGCPPARFRAGSEAAAGTPRPRQRTKAGVNLSSDTVAASRAMAAARNKGREAGLAGFKSKLVLALGPVSRILFSRG